MLVQCARLLRKSIEDDLGNRRPVMDQLYIDKLFSSMLLTQMLEQLDNTNLGYENQTSYRAGFLGPMMLTNICDYVDAAL